MKRTKRSAKKLEIISLIMAGGEGIRLWPLSTPQNPKPFIKLFGGKSFLKMAYERASTISLKEYIFISTLRKYEKRIIQELPKFPRKNLILEPLPKNTAPAIALAAMKLQKLGKDAVMAVMPADHYIHPLNKFKKAIQAAARKAKEGDFLLTFGVRPESPSTEYGYIEIEKQKESKTVFKVKRFTEKPSSKKARYFLKKGNYFWNSGMFVWKTDVIIKALEKHSPDTYKRIRKIIQNRRSFKSRSAESREFSKIRGISIDYAVMEKADNCFMVQLETDWKDFGSWQSIDEYFRKGKKDNFLIGNVWDKACQSSTIWTENGSVCAIGIKNMIVVQADGNIFLLDKSIKMDNKIIKEKIETLLNHAEK